MTRKTGRKPTNTLWIFCEGEKTEKNYFNKLKIKEQISRMNTRVVSSDSTYALGIVKHSVSFIENTRDYEKGDLVYCVFDRDGNTNQNLDKAIKLAKENKIVLIFSNPCFEYWILCHFEYFITACNVIELIEKLKTHIRDYRKNDPETYNKTYSKISLAINNAKKVRKKHDKEQVKLISRESNPSTLVYELIEKIKELKSS